MFKIFFAISFILISCSLYAGEKNYWRGGWGVGKDYKQEIATAKKLGFAALMQGGDLGKLKELCKEAAKEKIGIYYWISLYPRKKDKRFLQGMNKQDAEKVANMRRDKDPYKHGYQLGGEPINEQTNVFIHDLYCFHRPEVVKMMQDKIRKAFDACPELAGIAFDYFGYVNYRCCRCPYSLRLFEEYYKKLPPGTDREKALDKFSLESLVAFNNELAAFVRKLKPGSKIVTHIYPTYLPDPVYGNRLNVDYCCQTVAWYFKPYWKPEKIEKYTKFVIGEDKKYHSGVKGIPFVGIYQSKPELSKPTDVFKRELKIIRSCGTQSFSICPFRIFNQKPELGKVFLQEMGK